MLTPGYSLTASERVLPRLAIDFTTAVADPRVTTARAGDTATRINSSGVIEIVNANLPRFDYDPTTLVCKGQLVEDPRTNLFLNSLIDGTNLATQSVTLTAAAHTLSFYGSGSVSISGGHTATVDGFGNYPARVVYTFTPSAGSTTFTVTGDVKYAQIELGAFVTSFIPTAGTSVLRNADVLTMSGTNFTDWFNPAQGSFVFRGSVRTGSTRHALNGLLSTERFMTVSSGGGLGISDGVGSAATATGTGSGVTFTGTCSYGPTTLAVAINGNTAATGSSGNVLGAATQLQVGRRGAIYINGYVEKLLYFPQQLTLAEMAAFSK
jgi:hypothetical protein